MIRGIKLLVIPPSLRPDSSTTAILEREKDRFVDRWLVPKGANIHHERSLVIDPSDTQ